MSRQGGRCHHRVRDWGLWWIVGPLVASISSPALAQIPCAVTVDSRQNEIIVRHNTLEADEIQTNIELNIINRGETECVGILGTSVNGEQYGLWSTTSPQVIQYQLIDQKSRSDITPRGGNSTIRQSLRLIRLQPGESSLELISMVAVPGGLVSQGQYTQSIDVNFLSTEGAVLGSRPITLGVDVIPAAMIGVKGELARARGTNVVNLGELKSGVQDLPFTVFVASTGGYRVAVSSENRGRLKHESLPWFIDYRLRIGQFDLNLSTSAGFQVVSDRARLDNYPVTIDIGETQAKRAGAYRDTVTFTVAAI